MSHKADCPSTPVPHVVPAAPQTITPVATTPPPRRSERWDKPWKPLAERGQVGLLAATAWNSEYMLTVDGFNYVGYFEVLDHHGFVHRGLRTTLPDKATQSIDAVMLKPAEAASRGLSHPLQLVRFDVNGGRGVGEGGPFVMSALAVVDGSEEFPIRTWVAYEEARSHFRTFFSQQHGAMAALVDGAIAPYVQGGERMPERPWNLTTQATWLLEERELGIELEQAIESSVRRQETVDVPCGKCPPGAPCATCGPTMRTVEPRAVASVHARYRFDRTGKLVDEQMRGPTLVESPRMGR